MRRILLSAGLSVGLLFSSMPSLAQPAAPASKEKGAKEQATPAKPSARQLELARRYFAAMRFEETMTKMYENMNLLEAFEEEDDAELSGLDKRAWMEASQESLVALTPKMVDAMIPIVAATFTEEELEAIVVFYESPAGQASVIKAVDMMQPMMVAMMELMPDYIEDIVDRYCAKTTCSSALKEKLRAHES
ncbi:DUF2059 domain-containing protein [Caulobacter sp. SLTY]|uniref:DUF2059 domain-containing protein n=1 Tax=Caulobacter sp. SLTY TaxID=2683262 RepID=UPI001412F5A2|nr:DUF2059 domain-containing protein [Caulobacter sp. SLTY]